MNISTLKRQWERLGRQDPFWAVLTHPDKRDGRWQVDEFFKSGVDEIDAVLARAASLGLSVPRSRALDFGSGVGRLTQAMAGHFDRSDGVDISTAMVRTARRYDRHPGRCHYHVNAREDLSIFGDAGFDFIYSTLVLQHMEPQFAKAYIAEFLRVLAPDGLLVFQVPSYRVGVTATAGAAETAVSGPLPCEAFRAHLDADTSPLSLRAQERTPVRVGVENQSPVVWPSRPDGRGWHRIAVANRWLTAAGALVQRDDARAHLPNDVAPGARIDVVIDVIAPRHDGDYCLELDLVQEDVCWFAERGSQPLRVPCRVTGGLPSPLPVLEPAAAPILERPPFRERHPRAFRVLSVTGARDVYWMGRRAIDEVKSRRDAWRASTFNPMLNATRRQVDWWIRRPTTAVMEMHCVPQSDVEAIVTRSGGRVVDVEGTLEFGGYFSCRYWIKAPAPGRNYSTTSST